MADDDTLMPVTDAELDAIWNAVTDARPQDSVQDGRDEPPGSSSGDDSADGGRKRPSSAMIGIKAGRTSFTVPALREEAKRRRVLPEDGTWVNEDAADPGDRFGPRWRDEEISRQNTLERDPNYQFITAVAGATNTTVERLYDEDSLGASMRRRITEYQARLAGQEAIVDLEKLEKSLDTEESTREKNFQLQGEVMARQYEGFLAAAKRHAAAVETYINRVYARRDRVDTTNLLVETSSATWVGASKKELTRRVIDAEFGIDANEMGGVDPIGVNVSLANVTAASAFNPPMIINMMMQGMKDTVEELIEKIEGNEYRRMEELAGSAQYVKWGDVRRILNGLHEFAWPSGNEETASSTDAPEALCIALRRLIVLKHATHEERIRTVQDFVSDPSGRSGLDNTIRDSVRARFEKNAWEVWLKEAEGLVKVIETATTLLGEESQLTSPTEGLSSPPTEDERVGYHIMLFSSETDMRDAKVNAARLESLMTLARAEADNQEATTLGILKKGNLVGGVDLWNDKVIMEDVGLFGDDVVEGNTPDELKVWTDGLNLYETLGGDLLDRLGVEFPVSNNMREAARSNADIPTWSAEMQRPPPSYTTRMKRLWDRHTPVLLSAIGKCERVAGGDTTVRLTTKERTVYTIVRGFNCEVGPTEVDQVVREVGKSVLVFSARLYEADLLLAAKMLERVIEQQDKKIEATRERIGKITRGEPVVRAVPEAPYEHRRGWVEQPEHSGVVRLVPIVTQGIAAAWNRLRRLAPDITGAVDVEFLQHDPQMRPDFADLVAVEMALMEQRFPKKYIQLGQRAHTMTDLVSVVQRFRNNFELRHTPGGGTAPMPMPPRPEAGRDALGRRRPIVADITPSGRRGRGGGMILF